jgi:hypothetical protein
VADADLTPAGPDDRRSVVDGALGEIADRWRALDPLLPVPTLPDGAPELAVPGAVGAPGL